MSGKSRLITKSADEELKQAMFIVMVPDEVDLHGDITSEEDVRKACHNFNKFCRQPNLYHIAKTTSFEFVENYICPCDMNVNGYEIKKGTWLCTIQCLSDSLWELVKSGYINGVSIGALGQVGELKENE